MSDEGQASLLERMVVMSVYLTTEAVRAELAKVGEEYPNRTNYGTNDDMSGSCFYTSPEGEHCIAGEVLVRLGCEVPGWGEDGNYLTVGELLRSVLPVSTKCDAMALNVLSTAQTIADDGSTWQDAVRHALAGDVR